MIRSDNLRSAFTQEDVDRYIYDLLPKRDSVVSEIEAYAAENRIPIIGPAVARLLTLLVQISAATRIFEMGSAIGYSTIWLARAAGTKAEVFYTDGNPENARRAQEYFDLIFNDVDKHQYPDALRAGLPKLKRGGLFVTDNTLWSGKAAKPPEPDDKYTRGVQEFNRLVYASKELFPVLIPLRDGVTVCRKL